MSSVRIIDYAGFKQSVNFSEGGLSEEKSDRILDQLVSDVDFRSTDVQNQYPTEKTVQLPGKPLVQNLFYSPKWISALQRVYGFQVFTAIDKSKSIEVHLALIDNIVGKKLVSLPFSDYTDIDVGQSDDYQGLVEALKAQFPKMPIVFKTVGKTGKHKEDAVFGKVIRNALYHRIPTKGGVKMKDLQSSSFRRNVRKAEKTGTMVAMKRDRAALENFYTMYHELRLNKFGSIPQPFSFFECIFEEFVSHDKGFLLEASYENKPIASIMVLQHESVLYYKFGASTEESLDLRPNNLIFDRLISYAIDNEFEAIDLGLSGTGDSYKGLVRFKESMGGQPRPITYYQLDNGADNQGRNAEVKKWLGYLTDQIVAIQPNPADTSALSETIYPLFA